MCLIISKVDGYIEEKNGNKFLVLQIQTKKYTELWDEVKSQIKTTDNKPSEFGKKDSMKIQFNSDVNFPLKKLLKFYNLTIIVRSAFKEKYKINKYYPQILLDECLYMS